MADGRSKNGGARPNSGPKPKAERLGLEALLDKCWTKADREACIRKLAQKAKDPLSDDFMDAAKLLMAYTFGKPTEHKDITSNGETLTFTINLNGNGNG